MGSRLKFQVSQNIPKRSPSAKGSHKNNFTSYAAIWRLAALRKLGITGYTCACVACQAGASTPKIVNLAIVVCNRLHPVHRLNAVSTPQ